MSGRRGCETGWGGKRYPKARAEIVDRESAGHRDGVVIYRVGGLVGKLILGRDLADELLKQVLEGYDPGRRSVLVHNDGKTSPGEPELCQQRSEVPGQRDDRRRPCELSERDIRPDAPMLRGKEVTQIEHADDVIQILVVDRVADEGASRTLVSASWTVSEADSAAT
jgi:hypothetical protein